MVKRYCVLLLAVLFLTSNTFLIAGTTGKIAGKVTDSKTKEGIPSAIITVVGTTLGAATDFDGNYVIVNVPPGTYSVSVSYVGYQPTRVNNVGVNVDYTTTLNIQLNESSVELNEFIVEGERNPLIRQDQTNPVVSVTAENLQTLPVTSIAEVVGLQSGVVVSDDGALHIRGGRSNEISYTLNGISLNDPYDNTSSIGVATNALQEVSVSTGTFSAEYGNALSGVVNYVTKEGGRKFSGSVRTYTGDYFSNRKELFPHIEEIDIFNNTRLEATLGGPFFIEDLSFYGSGVIESGKGYLYGQRIYNPTDFYVTRDELNNEELQYDAFGNPLVDGNGNLVTYRDPRGNSAAPYRFTQNSPYYFNPLNKHDTVLYGLPSGDGSTVPLNTSNSFNIQGNIAYRLTSTMKLKYEIVYNEGKSQSAFYNSYRYNPDGRPTNYSDGIVHSFDWTHTLDNTTFYTIKGAYNNSESKTYAYESIDDPRYLPGFYQTTIPNMAFLTGGVSLGRTIRSTNSLNAKFDFVSQILSSHEIKIGAEVRKHELNLESYTLEFFDKNNPTKVITSFHDVYNDSIQYKARVPSVANGYTKYKREPLQISLYAQDKIELSKSLILNAGIRYEYFDPAAKYNTRLSDAVSARDTNFLVRDLTDASIKHSISPRLSIAYPITDQGVIRFSYGHFFQLGDLSQLYLNPNYRALDGVRPIFGNADVKPQRNVQYEIGLQQGLTEDLRLEVVGFYKDVRDYIFRQIVVTAKGDLSYELLTNLDYANSRGLTISLYQRRTPGSLFSSAVDYTFAVAEGNRTEPREDFFFSEKSGKTTETFLVPQSFDRRHTMNVTLSLTEPDNFNISNIWRLRTGSPYTPTIPASLTAQQSNFVQNSANKPLQWSADIKIEKFLVIGETRMSIFVLVDNVFDTENETDVYSNSGRALYNANVVANPTEFNEIKRRIERGDDGLIPLNTVTNYYQNPANVSSPRLVRVGFSILL